MNDCSKCIFTSGIDAFARSLLRIILMKAESVGPMWLSLSNVGTKIELPPTDGNQIWIGYLYQSPKNTYCEDINKVIVPLQQGTNSDNEKGKEVIIAA